MQPHADLDKLCELALSQGASAAAVLGARGVVLDPRVRLKCMVPRCANYGRNLMCPPNVMEVDEFAIMLKRFTRSILVQHPIPLDSELMEGLKDRPLEEIYDSGEYNKRMVRSERQFQSLLDKMESTALGMGCRFATALTGGPCRLCDECVGRNSQELCRHPFRSRPSMEAMGIDVFLTAKNAGIPFEIPAKGRPVWNGLLLVD